MKNINLAYVNLAFVVVGVIVIAYTFSVTFLSSNEIGDQPLDMEGLSNPQESLEVPAGASPESSVTRRSPGTQSSPARAPAEVRTPFSRTPPGRAPSNVRRPEGTSRIPNVGANRTTAGSPPSSGVSRPASPDRGQPGSGFAVTPSQGIDREKRSAPQSSPSSPPVRGSLDR